MQKTQMIEFGISCAKQHSNEPIIGILQDQSLKIEQRLLCLACIKEFQSFPSLINFEEAKRIIQDNQDSIYENICLKIEKILKSIQEFEFSIQELRNNLNNQLEAILNNVQMWRQNLLDLQKQQSNYILLNELDKMGQPLEIQLNQQQHLIDKCNYSYFNKMQFSQQMVQIMKSLVISKQQLNQIVFSIQENENVQIAKFNSQNVSQFQVNCLKHNSKIIYVDLSNSENRLKCMHCGQGDAITITEFEKRWESFYKTKMLRDRRNQVSNIKESLRKQSVLDQLMLELQQGTQQLIDLLNDNLFDNKFNSINNQQIADCSAQDQLLNIIEEICQKDLPQKMVEQKASAVTKIDSLQRVQRLVNQFREKIKSFYLKPVEYQMIDDSIQQQDACAAIAFNQNGSKMAAACDQMINLWNFENGKIKGEPIIMQGHTKKVICLVYSKTKNWIASGGMDYTLRLWKEINNNEWQSSLPVEKHTNIIFSLIMNKAENQLISGSMDHSIKIWRVNYENNQLIYEYSLEQHKDWVFSVSLNESETQLASCSQDCSIIIWGKRQDQRWEFQYKINQSVNDFGFRLSFINDNTIAWQQRGLGYTYFFEMEKGRFIEKPDLKIELKQAGNDVFALFPSVWNAQRSLLIQKHNQYVYIIRQLLNGKFKIECDPIDCHSYRNYGGLTNDGQYLVFWNDATYQFKVYKFIYE